MNIPYIKKEEIKRELASVINRHSLEQLSNTPDFVIAEYLFNCLMNHADSIAQRDDYYKVDHSYPKAIERGSGDDYPIIDLNK